ncbi:MAG: enolase C-terminal domain-like protein [Syntrophaceae bacterium]
MNIIKINIFQCNTPFKFSFHSPHMRRIQADSVVVELQFNNYISGYGESAPRPYVTGETCSSVVNTIQNHFSETLFQREINSLEDVEDTINHLEKECLNKKSATYNSALGAIDIALLDGLGKFQGVPLHNYLDSLTGGKISCSLSLPFFHNTIIKELYHKIQLLELDSIKIVMGNIEKDNIERVKFIRSLFGDQMEIRIEANGKWSLKQAISTLEKLKRFNIAGVEQPVAANDVEGLREIRHITGIPVIVDESICTLFDAEHLIEMGACDIINIKISKCGGLLKSKKIKHFAQSRNVGCQVGAHIGETDILSRSGQYFAMTTRDLFCFEGFSHLLFDNSWINHIKSENGEADPFSNNGLGVELTNQNLKFVCSLGNK